MTQSHMSKIEMSIFRTDLNDGNPEPRVRGTRTIKREIDYIESVSCTKLRRRAI